MKILHVLDHSLPTVDGYSIRSHNILVHQKKCGVSVLAVTSPKHEFPRTAIEDIDDIRFYRTLSPEAKSGLNALPFIKEVILMAQLRARILEVAQQEKIDLIHAHSPSLNGIPARLVARRLGVPVIYEMRSLWEEFPAGYHPSSFERLRFFISRQIETRLLQSVTSVAAISQGLQREIITRGVPENKTYVFPNGVDIKRFAPRPTNEGLKKRLGLQEKFIAGFIGSFSYWEGLEVLLRSLAIVAQQQPQIHTILVGSDEGDRYRTLAYSLQLQNFVTFTGSVTPEEVSDYYSIFDLCVYPRKRMRLTELVTPLKPLEAMALGKLVLASDVGGLRELVDDTKTGFLFRADCEQDLADKIIHIATNHHYLQSIGNSARDRVIAERDWLKIASHYKEVYRTLITPNSSQP